MLWWLWHNLLEALLSLISINCQTEMSSETGEKYVVLFVIFVFLYAFYLKKSHANRCLGTVVKHTIKMNYNHKRKLFLTLLSINYTISMH